MHIQGHTLKRMVDKKSKLGMVYYDAESDFEGKFCFNFPCLLFTHKLETIKIEMHFEKKRFLHTLDAKNFLIIPSGYEIRITPAEENCAFAFLFPTTLLYRRVKEHCKLDKNLFDKMFTSPLLVRRKNWMSELFLRYTYEMVETSNRENYVTKFLELEMMKELYFNYEEQEKNTNPFQFAPSLHSFKNESPLLQKSFIFIENHLMQNLTVKKVAQGIHTSEATLLRAFRKNLDSTVEEYIRIRKLQEAKFILKSRQHNISETAFMLGYNSLSAFSKAFKKKLYIL